MAKSKKQVKNSKSNPRLRPLLFVVAFAFLAGVVLNVAFGQTYYGNNSSSVTQGGTATSGSVINGQVTVVNGNTVSSVPSTCQSGQTCRSGNVVFVNRSNSVVGQVSATTVKKITTSALKTVTTTPVTNTQGQTKQVTQVTNTIGCPAGKACQSQDGQVLFKNNTSDNLNVQVNLQTPVDNGNNNIATLPEVPASNAGNSQDNNNTTNNNTTNTTSVVCNNKPDCSGSKTTIVYNPGGSLGDTTAQVVDPNTSTDELDNIVQSIDSPDTPCASGDFCANGDSMIINNSPDDVLVNTSGDGVVISNQDGTNKVVCKEGSGQVCNRDDVVVINRKPSIDLNSAPNETIKKYLQSVEAKKLTCRRPRVIFIYDLTSRSFFGTQQYKYFYNTICGLHF